MWLAMEYETLFSTRRKKNSLCESRKIYAKHQQYVTQLKIHEFLPRQESGILAVGPSLPKSVLHTVARVGLQELGVYHILLRICTESTEETQSSFCGVLQPPFCLPLPTLTCFLTPLQPHWPPASSSNHTSAVSGPLLAAPSSWSTLIPEIHIANYFCFIKEAFPDLLI